MGVAIVTTRRCNLASCALLALAVVMVAGATGAAAVRASAAQAAATAALHELHGWAELQSDFNRDYGVPRLVLLLSPT